MIKILKILKTTVVIFAVILLLCGIFFSLRITTVINAVADEISKEETVEILKKLLFPSALLSVAIIILSIKEDFNQPFIIAFSAYTVALLVSIILLYLFSNTGNDILTFIISLPAVSALYELFFYKKDTKRINGLVKFIFLPYMILLIVLYITFPLFFVITKTFSVYGVFLWLIPSFILARKDEEKNIGEFVILNLILIVNLLAIFAFGLFVIFEIPFFITGNAFLYFLLLINYENKKFPKKQNK